LRHGDFGSLVSDLSSPKQINHEQSSNLMNDPKSVNFLFEKNINLITQQAVKILKKLFLKNSRFLFSILTSKAA